MTDIKKKVLLTGAAGTISAQLLPALREAYELILLDVTDRDRDGNNIEGIRIFDLLNGDPAEFGRLCEGVEVIVHTGYLRAKAGYADERRNVDMMNLVYETAVAAGVRRVVSASTNQAAKWYEQPYFQGRLDRVTPDDYPRPDSFYGWAKAAYESLGFLYACGSIGRPLEVVQVRIVAPREIDLADYRDRPRRQYFRDIAGYVSPRDLQQLFVKSIDAPQIEDGYGVPFQIFYGVSNNARTFWSITNAREVIGYQPEDDSEIKFAADIARMITP